MLSFVQKFPKSEALSSEVGSTSLLISKCLPLCMVLIISIVEASVAAFSWSSTSLELLFWFCLLQNPGNKPKTEPNILEKELGLLVALTRNLCLLGSQYTAVPYYLL